MLICIILFIVVVVQGYKFISSINSTKITLKEFNEIKMDMSYERVVSIIGDKGTLISESEISGITTKIYSWQGSGSAGTNAVITFQNNEVINKTQLGLT